MANGERRPRQQAEKPETQESVEAQEVESKTADNLVTENGRVRLRSNALKSGARILIGNETITVGEDGVIEVSAQDALWLLATPGTEKV